MIIFAVENFATLKKTTLKTLTVSTVKWSNGYLLLGILTGFAIALGLAGEISLDIALILKAHVYAVLGGYVLLTIMGLSLILIPMFSLAHGFDERAIAIAFRLVVSGVAVVFAGAIIGIVWVMYIGYLLTIIGVFFYLWQIYIIARLTVRKELDIWAKSMLFAYASLIVAIIFGILYFFSSNDVQDRALSSVV